MQTCSLYINQNLEIENLDGIIMFYFGTNIISHWMITRIIILNITQV
jgi:hypothetical protein